MIADYDQGTEAAGGLCMKGEESLSVGTGYSGRLSAAYKKLSAF